MTTTTSKTLRLRWLRFKRHLGSGPTYRRYATAQALAHRIPSADGTRGPASSVEAVIPRALPGRQTLRGAAFALLAFILATGAWR